LSNFIGTFKFAVDKKGRFSIPTVIRDGLSSAADGAFVVHPGAENCLKIYPQDEWRKRVKLLRSLPGDKLGRYYRRVILGDARPCKMDGHHRILVPPELLARAGITDTVVIVGQLEYLELWEPGRYEAYLSGQHEPIEDVHEQIESILTKPRPRTDESD